MKVGSSVWYGHRPYAKRFEELSQLGFEYFEFALDYPLPDENEEILSAAKEYEIALHAPLDILLASPREEVFKASMKVLEKSLKLAEKLEVSYFNFHAFHLTPTFLFREVRERSLKNFEKVCNFAINFGEEAGFEVCLENDRFFTEDYIKGRIRLTLDLGHFAVEESVWGRDYRKSLEKFVEKHGSRIKVIHIHDVDLELKRDHLPLGSGQLDFDLVNQLIKKIKPTHVLLEIFWKSKARGIEFAGLKELKYSLDFLRRQQL
jgi:sugar phosphate isomerase/epimerase